MSFQLILTSNATTLNVMSSNLSLEYNEKFDI